ncbi:glycosyltransferase [Nocardioides terrisoli]|uniref:glycosyltransferase n=1 Tax=Nocardioides terrisoli TaxID=3388267 RepID=UPI00287BBE68|nr:glycosyltransferase [Nocardioides marmorisolisilvae]
MSLHRSLRRAVARPAERAARRLRSPRYTQGLLSVVVPIYNVEAFVDECLTSLREQDYDDVEIIVVDDGSPDGSRDVAERHAREDRRVRVLTRLNGGLGAARNTGIDAARGEFLAFIDSDDVVTRDVFSVPLEGLVRSGSDFSVTGYERLGPEGTRDAGWWIREVHAQRRLGCTLEAFPQIQVNAVAWSKVYRRTFWEAAALRFPEGLVYEDQPVSSRAYARARGFDVHPEIGVRWRVREDRTSLSQQTTTAENLRDHNEAVRLSLSELTSAGQHRAEEVRALQLVTHNLSYFTPALAAADDDFRAAFREALQMLLDRVARADYVRTVGVRSKVLHELVLQGRTAELVRFLGEAPRIERRTPTSVGAGGVTAHLDIPGLPDDCLLLSDRQTRLRAGLLWASWGSGGELRLRGYAFVRNVDLSGDGVRITLALVSPTGDRIDLPVRTVEDPEVDILGGHEYCDQRAGGFAVDLPEHLLPSTPGTHVLEASVSVAGLTRTGGVDLSRDVRATLERTVPAERGVLRSLGETDTGEAALEVDRPDVYAVANGLDADGLVLDLHAPPGSRLRLGISGQGGTALELEHDPVAGGIVRARLPRDRIAPLLASDRAIAACALWAELPDERVAPVAAAPGTPLGSDPVPAGGGDGLELVASSSGQVSVQRRRMAARTLGFAADDGQLTVDLELLGVDAAAVQPHLNSRSMQVRGTWDRSEGLHRVRFPLQRSRWGRDGLALPPGSYKLQLDLADGSVLHPSPVTTVLDALPHHIELRDLSFTVVVTGGRRPTLRFRVEPPVPLAHRSARAQRMLREQAAVAVAARPAVVFRACGGELADGDALAVQQELVRRSADLELLWSVRDRSVVLPREARGLVEGTAEWHGVVAASRYLVVDAIPPGWPAKPAGQVVVRGACGASGDPSGCDYVLSCSGPGGRSGASYGAAGAPTVLRVGCPSHDLLRSADAARIRDHTREMLGIDAGQHVVLCADDGLLDVAEARRALGDEYVFLLRRPAGRAGAVRRGGQDGIVDASDHPCVNELLLGGDAAVLAHPARVSTLGPACAVVDLPMVFFAPGAALVATPGSADSTSSEPGPRATSVEEVVALLGDLPALGSSHARARADLRSACLPGSEFAGISASSRLVDAVFVPRGDAPQRRT